MREVRLRLRLPRGMLTALLSDVDKRDTQTPWRILHSSIVAWRIPWIEEPGGLQSMRSQRVRSNLAHTHVGKTRTLVHNTTTNINT